MLPMVAICLTLIVTCTALTVDLGRISTTRRNLQNVADAVALDLVRLVDGRTAGEIEADPLWTSTRTAVLERNDFAPDTDAAVEVTLGTHDVRADVFHPVASPSEVPTAVRVVVGDTVDFIFVPGASSTDRLAVAQQSAAAGLQVGSFAARLDSGGSALVGALLGDALGVTVVGYEGLVGVDVGLEDLASGLGLTLASPDELLTTEVTLLQVITAQADALAAAGHLAQAEVLDDLALALPHPDETLALGDVVTILTGGSSAAALASLDALEVLTAVATVVDGDGFFDLGALDLGVPGVTTTSSRLELVERPRFAFGGTGTTVETAQARLVTDLAVTGAGLVGAELQLAVEVASAEAAIRSVRCGAPDTLDVEVRTGLAHAAVELTTRVAVAIPPPLAHLGTLEVAEVTVSGGTGAPGATGSVHFEIPPDELGVPVPASTPGLDLPGVGLDTEVTILPGLGILAPVLGVVEGLVDGVVVATLLPLVDQTVTALDDVLVGPLATLLGLEVAGADVTPLAVACSGVDLVA